MTPPPRVMSHLPVPRPLRDPFPLDPNHADVVDGAHVTLRWEAVDGAEAYAVDVAEDPEFHDVLFTREVPASTVELAVDVPFPSDDRTLYWRVSAGNALGWSGGGRIESFTSGSPDQAGHFADPDEDEPFGPFASLLWSFRQRRRSVR